MMMEWLEGPNVAGFQAGGGRPGAEECELLLETGKGRNPDSPLQPAERSSLGAMQNRRMNNICCFDLLSL